MDTRIVQFIAALRNAGVRVSVAESADAMRAISASGIDNKDLFRLALRATLVKEAKDMPTFEDLFPNFFGSGAPPLPQQPGGGMSDEEREQLEQQLEQMLQNMTPEQLRQLFESMMTGQNLTREQLEQMLKGPLSQAQMQGLRFAPWATRQAMRALEFERLGELLRELIEKLRQAGVSEEALRQLAAEALENRRELERQINQEIGRQMQQPNPNPQRVDQLLDTPFEDIRAADVDSLRNIINRLAAQLRSRAALRQRRANKGTIDVKHTIRANLRYQGVPLEIQFRKKHQKPKLVVICDRSVSTETVVRFLLLMIYALQDQVSRTRAFAFIETIYDISMYFNELRPEQAVDEVMRNVYPKRSYSTDLGASLGALLHEHGGDIDRRTTVIILGDGRNNENDPGLNHLDAIKRRAKRIVWFNPEHPGMWGRYDPGSLSSDMLKYLPLCDAVHHVSNLRELAAAVESLFD